MCYINTVGQTVERYCTLEGVFFSTKGVKDASLS